MGAGSFSINTTFKAQDKVTPTFNSMTKGAGRFENRLARLSNRTDGFGSCISGTFKKISAAANSFLGLFALSKIKQFGDDATRAAQKQLEVEQKLTSSLKNNVSIRVRGAEAYLKASDDIFKMASKIQEKGVIGDEVLIGGAQVLSSMKFDDNAIKKMLPLIADMVVQQKGYNATIQDAETIAKGLGRAMAGNIGSLSKLGVVLDKNQKKQLQNMSSVKRTEYLYKLLSSRIGGVNESFALSDQGAKAQYLNNIGDRIEEIGKKIIPIEGHFYRFLNKQMPLIGAGIENFFKGIDYGFRTLEPVYKKISELLGYIGVNLSQELLTMTPLIKTLFEGVVVPGLILILKATTILCKSIEILYTGVKNFCFFIKDNLVPVLSILSTVLSGVLLYNFSKVSQGLLGMLVRFQALAKAIAWNTICVYADTVALLAQAKAFMMTPIGKITLLITGLIIAVTLLWKNWDKVTQAVTKFWNVFYPLILTSVEVCKNAFSKIGSYVKTHLIDWLVFALGPIGWIIKGIQKIQELRGAKYGKNDEIFPDFRAYETRKGRGGLSDDSYMSPAKGTITVRTTLDNSTPFEAKTSARVEEENNMSLIYEKDK